MKNKKNMTQSFDFKLQLAHTKHSGSAVIIENRLDIYNAAKEAFESDGDDRQVSVNEIGLVYGPAQEGYKNEYFIFEAYTDSGSEDYYYFAVMYSSQEI